MFLVTILGIALGCGGGAGGGNPGTTAGTYGFVMFVSSVEPGFFQTMGIARLRGRDVQRGDQDEVVVSESLARRMWPGKDPPRQTVSGGPVEPGLQQLYGRGCGSERGRCRCTPRIQRSFIG